MSFLATTSLAAGAADDNPLASERWRARPLVLVVPAAGDPMLVAVESALRQGTVRAEFLEREMVLFTVVAGQGSRDGKAMNEAQTRGLLQAVGASPADPATAFLVGKDGGIKLAERGTLSLDAVFTLIDGMPMRRR
nr:DUF4174 domain-containing protein [Variovorax boronicumulans]